MTKLHYLLKNIHLSPPKIHTIHLISKSYSQLLIENFLTQRKKNVTNSIKQTYSVFYLIAGTKTNIFTRYLHKYIY